MQIRAFVRSTVIGLSLASAASLAAAQNPPEAREILVFGAASLTESLEELGKAFEGSTGTKVSFSFGSSSDLARQIEAGAPADAFFSADTAKMDAVENAGLVRKADRREFLSNVLVVVVPSDSTAKVASAKDLETFPKLALADPAAVPAGVYAKRWLIKEGVWDALERKVIPMLDVRAALAAVGGADVPAGIVYRTDAAISERVRVAYVVTDGPAITYSVAPIASSRNAAAAAKFVAFLDSPEGRRVFERRGFLVRPSP
jgi:molybdate transport system substrate-binding protein